MTIYYIKASETTSYDDAVEASSKDEAENIFMRRVENYEPSDISGFQIDSIKRSKL